MKYCLRCNAANPDNQVRCQQCSNLFFSATVPDHLENNHPQIVCSGCMRYIASSRLVCPNCGHSVETSQADARIPRHMKWIHASSYEMLIGNGDVIGRAFSGTDLLKKDLYVSEAHLRVRQAGKFFEVTDISGGNGFILNGRMCPLESTQLVKSGDIITIGVTKFRIVII